MKNLIVIVVVFKEKYLFCEDVEIFFCVGLKLNGDNGEVEVVKVLVECEVEVKEGFVDGVKNFFGFGKKDQEFLIGDEVEVDFVKVDGFEEKMKDDIKLFELIKFIGLVSFFVDVEVFGFVEEVKVEIKKKFVGILVDIDFVKVGIFEFIKEEVIKFKDRLKVFNVVDKVCIV